MKYIDVCKALYDYEAGSEDELSFKEDDILYILERDDDDWWKAQLKLQQPDEVGPIGLIPANYASEVLFLSNATLFMLNVVLALNRNGFIGRSNRCCVCSIRLHRPTRGGSQFC